MWTTDEDIDKQKQVGETPRKLSVPTNEKDETTRARNKQPIRTVASTIAGLPIVWQFSARPLWKLQQLRNVQSRASKVSVAANKSRYSLRFVYQQP